MIRRFRQNLWKLLALTLLACLLFWGNIQINVFPRAKWTANIQIVHGWTFVTFRGITTASSQRMWADYMITDFSRDEPLGGAIKVRVTPKPTYSINVPIWKTVGGI